MKKKIILEILYDTLKLLQNIDLIEPHNKRFKKEYQRRIIKAYDEIFELIKVLEADD